MYKANDIVTYSTHGVCRIISVETCDFSGKPAEYYVLRPENDSRNTFYVPTDNKNLTSQMHRVLSRGELDELIKAMPDEKFIWIEDDNLRKSEYEKILRSGNRQKLIQLIKTLYIHRKEKMSENRKLRSADEHFLKDAETALYEEFAYVLNIPKEQVLPYIQQHI